MYESYKYLLFESEEDSREELVYQKQIDDLNKYFFWEILCLNISNKEIKKMEETYKMKFEDVLNYLVVVTQDRKIEEMRTSKNILPI